MTIFVQTHLNERAFGSVGRASDLGLCRAELQSPSLPVTISTIYFYCKSLLSYYVNSVNFSPAIGPLRRGE